MIVEKNGRLYGKGTGFGGSAVVNPNIFSDSEEFWMSNYLDWLVVAIKDYSGDNSINIIIQEPKCILDK